MDPPAPLSLNVNKSELLFSFFFSRISIFLEKITQVCTAGAVSQPPLFTPVGMTRKTRSFFFFFFYPQLKNVNFNRKLSSPRRPTIYIAGREFSEK